MLDKAIIPLLSAYFADEEFRSHKDYSALRHKLEFHLRKADANDRALIALIEAVAQQNQELRARVGILVRLMVERGLITNEEFTREVNETKQRQLADQTSAATAAAALRSGTRKNLPKPPRKLGPSSNPTPAAPKKA